MSGQVSLTTGCDADRTVFSMSEALASLKPITYGEVRDHLEQALSARLEAEGKSQKRVSNFRTTMKRWMEQFGLSERIPVGVEVGAEFTKYLELYSKAMEGMDQQTIADRRSMMVAYRETWVHLRQAATADTLEGDFAQTLVRLIELSGTTTRAIARAAGVGFSTVKRWRRGRCLPTKRFLPAVHRLEEIFGLPVGVLVTKLPKVLCGNTEPIKSCQTGHRKHGATLKRLPYRLKEFPPTLQGEWDDLVRFYTDAAWLRMHGLKRNSKWRVREHDNSCPTASRVRSLVSEFMGYLCLPSDAEDPRLRGMGFQPDELTLGAFSDSGLVYNFSQFMRERSYLKHYNSGTFYLFSFSMLLLRKETGFLWQQPEFGSRLPMPVSAGDWQAWCERHRAVIKSTQKDLTREGEFKKTRDPFEPISTIIQNNQHPLDVLFELAADYEADAPPRHASPHCKAVHRQNLFLIKFVTVIPLRVFNISVMTWKPDGTGNLYQKPDGAWWVRFDPSYLKNHKGAAKDRPFDVPVHPSLWPYVEEFLFTHRPHLAGAAACDYVFRPALALKATETRHPGRAVAETVLSRRVFKITQRYIQNCPGFGLHAFRHLVATEYIKNNSAGYAIAAAVLYDKEKTVRSNYAWVTPADTFGFWNDYVSTLLNDQGREEDE